MHKWVVEQWREGERVRRMEFTEEMIRQLKDGTVVIHFPPRELAGGGLTLVTDDELHINEKDE